jgi:type IV pilus assembly protein PilM
MFSRSLITVEIGARDIKILVGNKNVVKYFGTIKTPSGAFAEDKIINVKAIAKVLSAFLKEKGIKSKDISFAVQGQDVIIRHMETPIMDNQGIWDTLQWEVSQFLPDGGQDYYSDYEITDKIITKEKRVYKVLSVSVPKDKIDRYIKLAQKLQFKLVAIDIAPNNVSRVFRNVHKRRKEVKSIGVIYIGNDSSNFTILDHGKLFIEREVPFGIDNCAREISNEDNLSSEVLSAQFISEFSFDKVNENETFERIGSRFDTMFSAFQSIIQFYATGMANKTLDLIYVIGEGANIKDIDEYISSFFDTPAEVINSSFEIGMNIKLPMDCDIKRYVNTLGLLLRKE